MAIEELKRLKDACVDGTVQVSHYKLDEIIAQLEQHASAKEAPAVVDGLPPLELPRPACTYADHSYPAYSARQVEQIARAYGQECARKTGAGLAVAFQDRVQPWMMACFGEEISNDLTERNHRFLEEALELVQSTGCTQSEAHQLVDYVFGRPVGEPNQEVGGVMVTLAALCLAAKLNMHAAGETELARIWTKVEQIRAKQAAKPKHSPLPQHVTAPPAAVAQEPVAVPDGWKMVPVEPTPEMLAEADSGDRRYTDRHLGKDIATHSQGAYDNYLDMLRAAPTLPTPPAAQAGDAIARALQLREAIATVCEGWTLPSDARKVLETALWARPDIDTAMKEKP